MASYYTSYDDGEQALAHGYVVVEPGCQYLEPSATKALSQTLTASERAAYLAKNTWITWSGGEATFSWDKFLEHILTARYASGFANSLMAKDLQLYVAAAREFGTSTRLGWHTADIWQDFADDEPGADFTRIFPYIEG